MPASDYVGSARQVIECSPMPKKSTKTARAPRNGPMSLAGLSVEDVLGAVLRIAPNDAAKIRAKSDGKAKGKRKGK